MKKSAVESKNSIRYPVRRFGLRPKPFQDFYHNLLEMPWLVVIFIFVSGYLLVNAFFASLYYFGGDVILNARPSSYWDAFFFSFQTSATIGYGHLLPKTFYAHVIVIFDSISGMLFVAMMTGLAFAKFSRPKARVLFSRNILRTQYEGKDVLMVRLGNARKSHIQDASVKIVVTKNERSTEGISMRRMYDLDLVRSESPLFVLGWTLIHEIDEASPLYEMSDEDLLTEEVTFILSLTGIDDVYSQNIYDRHVYLGSEIKRGEKFVDISGRDEKGYVFIDYRCFHDIQVGDSD